MLLTYRIVHCSKFKKENCELSLCYTITIAPWQFLGLLLQEVQAKKAAKTAPKSVSELWLW